jgi:hypothetical protein
MFNEILQKSVVGFFFGLGASVSVVVMIFTYETYSYEIKQWFGPTYVHYSDQEITHLEIISHKQRNETEQYTVVGKVSNTGSTPLKDILVKIEIIDGEFILGSCHGSVDGGQYLNKGDVGYFSIDCRNLKTDETKYPYKISLDRAVAYER